MTRSEALYSPPDVEAAWGEWRCTCGPAATAAILGISCAEVRSLFPGHKERGGWANPTHVRKALEAAPVKFRVRPGVWPSRGLAFVQIEGPWCDPGVPVGAAYKRTHWVACLGDLVWDINDGCWRLREAWECTTLQRILLHHGAKATGWRVRTGIEVSDAGA